MVDTIASVVISLAQKLTQLLVDEAKFLSGVEDKVRALCDELKMINVVLEKSKGKRDEHEIDREVVSQIGDVANEAEDVVDSFVTNVVMDRRRNIVEKLYHRKDQLKMLHEVAGNIQKINGKVQAILNNKVKYSVLQGESTSGDNTEAAESLHKRRRDVEEEEVVGFLRDSDEVIDKLIKSGSGRNVVSIIGMGGLGKTTLARKIYNNNQVQKLFPSRAWGFVSNDYRVKELLLSLLQCLLSPPEYNDLFRKKAIEEDKAEGDKATTKEKTLIYIDPLSEEELRKKVRKCLNGKKYLVVLDDVWKTQVWDEVQDVFPDDHRGGSRILITSRIKEVAFYTSRTPPYYLPFLNKQESWDLFSRKVFGGEDCPSDLEPLGREIAEGCGGLPLVIVVLAGLLRRKELSYREWSKVKSNIKWYLDQDAEQIKVSDILKLSYDNLPRRLKPCFLYFGIYPEDYEIPVQQLIHLWIAEGLIQEIGTRNPEDVADDYLDDLVDRCLIQVASWRTDGGVKTCRIHDLLRDLCISESIDGKFFEVCTESNIRNLSNPRRLSLQCGTGFFYMSSSACDHKGTRSLFCFGQEVFLFTPKRWKWLLRSFKLARVLYLGGVTTYSISREFEKLIHLRYLRIDTNNLEAIPASICRLWSLETLDVRGSPINTFSSRLWKLQRLRHLYMSGPVRLPERSLLDLSGSDSKIMSNLQTLSTVALDSLTMSLVEIGRFPKLTTLGLCYDRHGKCDSREQLRSLQRLTNLQKLKIIGTSDLPSLPNDFPSNVTKITLIKFDVFSPSCVNTLAKLTKLQVLKLTADYHHHSFDINCATGDFPQLQVLQMVGINVKRWILHKGAMPRLRRLLINNCRSLKELPEEIWSLTTLREVKALWASKKLANVLQNVEVMHGCKLIISESDSV